mgnify:CR=1 FL=1
MPSDGKKGITVKIDADLHAEVRQYIESHEMTMAEFVSLALQDELHPKLNMKEEKYMGKMRTLALQIPEELFQRIKDYLLRNNMTQKDFMIGLIENELERDQTERESLSAESESVPTDDEETAEEQEETAPVSDFETVSEETTEDTEEQTDADFSDEFGAVSEETDDSSENEDEDESEDENMGFSMGM